MTISTIASLQKQLADKSISSSELSQDYLQKIAASELNAFITVDEAYTLKQAQAADSALANADNTQALTGIPIAHKDIFCTEGVLTTCGSKMLSNFVAPYTATVVDKLNNSGLVSLGKTNMDEFAMGSSNENSFYGAVSNPWDTDRVPGGSSGGSAAAVSAGLAPVATGTDTGGSIRQPAAFCNLVGVKPSYGRCSRYGMVAFASSLDQAGVFTHTAEDAAITLSAMCGFDPRDATSLNVETPDFTAELGKSLDGLKIGLPEEYFSDGLNNEVASQIDAAIKQFEALGATVKSVSLPNSSLAVPCYYVIAPAEASSNLSRFDGVRYGFRAEEYSDLMDMYATTRSQGFGDEVKRRIMMGTYALSSGYYDAYYAKAQKIRRLISDDFTNVFADCDVIMGPTTPDVAFAKGSKTDDPVAMYLEDIYTVPVNLAGLPAASIPAGFTQAGLPVGLHIIAPYLQESRLLNVAHQYQQATDWHLATPTGGDA